MNERQAAAIKDWRGMNNVMHQLTEQEVLELLEHEKVNARRPNVLERLHARYNSLRVARERNVLIGEAGTDGRATVSDSCAVSSSEALAEDSDGGRDFPLSDRLSNEASTPTAGQFDEQVTMGESDLANFRVALQMPLVGKVKEISQAAHKSKQRFEAVVRSASDSFCQELDHLLSALENERAQLKATIMELESRLATAQTVASKDESSIAVSPPNIPTIDDAETNEGHPGGSRVLVIGIPDLEKRNEEAVFDALSEFEKKCPYCGKDQYRIGIRDKIEIDHFIPVSKGGQDVPWNLLPVCKDCNRKKRDRLPGDFLQPDIFQRVNAYLIRVQQRHQLEGIESHASLAHLAKLIRDNANFIRAHASNEFISTLVHLVSPDKVEGLQSNEAYLVDLISRREGDFAKGVVAGPFHNLIDRLQVGAPVGTKLHLATLFHALKAAGWRDAGKLHSREYKTKKHGYCAPEFFGMGKSALRRIVEESNAPADDGTDTFLGET